MNDARLVRLLRQMQEDASIARRGAPEDMLVRPGEPFRPAGGVVFVPQSDLLGGVILVGEDGNEHAVDALDIDDRGACFHFFELRAGAEVEECGDAKGSEGLDAIRGDLGGFRAAKDELAANGFGWGSGDGMTSQVSEVMDPLNYDKGR